MTSPTSGSAEELRRAFDATFARSPPPRAITEDFLTVRAATRNCAVRLRDVARLVAAPPVAALPSVAPHLVGIAGIRGSLVAIHALAILLGEPARGGCQWIMLCTSHPSIGLAVDAIDGFVRLPIGARDVVRVGHAVYPVVDVARTLEAIEQRKRAT